MAKKVTGYTNRQIPAGQANPSPPVGPALGQQGVNIMEFCKAFNAQTQALEKGLPTPGVITVYSDRSFAFIMKPPPASVLIAKALGIPKGSATPNTAKVGKVSRKQLEDIAKVKMPDLTASHLEGAAPAAWAATWRDSKMAAIAKRTKTWKEKLPPGKSYPIDDALKLVKEFATAKFNESVDGPVNLA